MKPVKTIYSKAILSNPHVRQALGHLPVEQRIVQMCSIETLEQIRHTMPGSYPDLLVPFSTTGGRISGHVLDASGGAFRSRGQWYDISYRCESDAKVTTILSYRFQIGEPVPRGEWAARKLPAN
nr:DUF930 domain-containing protein [Allorhizobium sonneratiae]